MRNTRTVFVAALAGGIIGAMLVSMGPAMAAAVGDALQLGKTNTINKRTTLRGDVGHNLRVINTDPAGEALDLVVEAGNPPMRVNSDELVKSLNADRVDGMNANEIIRVGSALTRDMGGPAGNLNAAITAPGNGFLVMSGSVWGGGVDASLLICRLKVDGRTVAGTHRATSFPDRAGAPSQNCATDGVKTVGPGRYTVTLNATSIDANLDLADATVWVLFVPYNQHGAQPVFRPRN